MSEWKETTLGELIDIKHGWAFKGEFFDDSKPLKNIVVAIGNFDYAGGFRFHSTKVKQYLGEYPKDYELKSGDILLAMTCQTAGGEILGIPGRIPNDNNLYLHNQRLGKIEIKDFDCIDESFIYWLCLWKKFNHHLFSTATGTKILHTAPERIKSFNFSCPPIEIQKEIGKTLDTLDAKIENLRKQNETLERIAQTLFKHWFIDFEFPNEKGEPYRSSGGAMQPSELGEIPACWRVGKLGDYCTIFRGSSPRPISSPVFFKNGTLPWIKIADATRAGSIYISETREFCTEAALPFTRFLKKGSLILSNSATVGIPMILNLDGCIHDGWLSFSDYQEITRNFLYFVLINKLKFLTRYADGTVQKNLNTGILKKMDFILPPPNSILIEEFTDFSQSIFDKILINEQQIQTLTKTRDTLLPKLMSGKLRVTE